MIGIGIGIGKGDATGVEVEIGTARGRGVEVGAVGGIQGGNEHTPRAVYHYGISELLAKRQLGFEFGNDNEE